MLKQPAVFTFLLLFDSESAKIAKRQETPWQATTRMYGVLKPYLLIKCPLTKLLAVAPMNTTASITPRKQVDQITIYGLGQFRATLS